MNNFINLRNGDIIHKDAIRAIRLGEPRPKGEWPYQNELKPRVIVDFVIGEHGNCSVLDCESIEQRDSLAEDLKAQIRQP